MKSFRAVFSILVLLACCFVQAVQANKASLNADGVLVIDGKKIFPIGFTTSPNPDTKAPSGKNAIAELSDAGATFLRAGPLGKPWSEERFVAEKKMQDAAAKYGMHCWLDLREGSSLKTNDSRNEKILRRLLTTFKDHPGMGVYKGNDEPEWGKAPVDSLDRAYKIIKDVDPHHPLVIIQAPRGTVESLKKYDPVCDIAGFDVYPVGYPPGLHSQFAETNNELSMIGDYTKRMVEIRDGNKAIWMTLQIAWSGATNPGKTLRYPTFHEQRFMAYQAIINGARGLMYFGGAIPSALTEEDKKSGWNWRFWNHVLRRLVEEIGSKSALYPALVTANSTLPIKVKGTGIEYCVREVGDEIFILACKRNHTTEKIEFSGLPATAATADVLFEEPRKVQIKDGSFIDWLAPFEVHVYRLKRAN